VLFCSLALLLANALAVSTLAAYSNEDARELEHQQQHQHQQQQQQQQNHYEEPLALASNEDASQDPQQAKQNKAKRTLYACEEKQLEIDCQPGESIQLIRANYGRFSIQICNEHGTVDWKVNCMSPDSFDIIARR
jgi:hemolysin activation/secretion protein